MSTRARAPGVATAAGRTTPGSASYMERACRVIPRGVASAMRANQRPTPLAFVHAEGARLVDVDGNEYVDYVLGFGPALLGHRPPAVLEAVRAQLEHGVLYGAQHRLELELAERVVGAVPNAEMTIFSSTGSEALHAALRVARAATRRRLVVKFEGHYHGWVDPLFVNVPGVPAGTGEAPLPIVPAVEGEPPPVDVLVCRFNDLPELARMFSAQGAEIAAVVMEPVPCNLGTFEPTPGYLEGVRALCDAAGALLIFDEVITGFRLALGGAQERYGVLPDLSVFAKAVSSGFPLSLVTGTRKVMRAASEGPVRHVGTYNGNAISVAAAAATLAELERRREELYPALERTSSRLADGLRMAAAEHRTPLAVNRVGPVLQLLWEPVLPTRSYADVAAADPQPVADLAAKLLARGVHSLERGLWFVSAAHDDEDIERTIDATGEALAELVHERRPHAERSGRPSGERRKP